MGYRNCSISEVSRALLADVAAAALEHLPQGVHQSRPDRKALNALGSPLGTDPVARHAPDLLRVGLEKCAVQFPAETVHKELLQGFLLFDGKQGTPNVAHPDLEGAPQAKLEQRVLAERNRVIEETAQIVNAGLAGPQQHHTVRGVRVGAGCGGRDLPLHAVVFGGDRTVLGGLERKHLQPPLHDAVGFRKKAMTTDVDPVAFVVHRAGDSTHAGAFFQDNRLDAGAGEQFVGGSQSGGTCANDDSPR